jgi:phage shock protein E
MFEFIKNIFAPKDNTKLIEAVANGALLVDVRSPQEFASGHVPGSINIPLDRIATSTDTFKEAKQIVVFCRSGNRSAAAKGLLNHKGFDNVINGGTWQDVNECLGK